jgi:hypothetical protein
MAEVKAQDFNGAINASANAKDSSLLQSGFLLLN